jgi:uncharacterized protein
MILEGLVTTVNADGSPHLAPMGPRVSPEMTHFTLKPFNTSKTYQNLKRMPEGVLHITDDVLLLAKAAVNAVSLFPKHQDAHHVNGYILSDACRYFEFRITELDDSQERVRLEAEVLHTGTLRDFFGFNRAKHAVLEAAILATRLHFLNLDEVEAEFQKLRVIVNKTAGPAESEAMTFLEEYLVDWRRRPRGT